MLNETAKQLLNAPKVPKVVAGVNSYPRVLRQDDRDDGAVLVHFAMPGLRRVKMWVPETQWVNGDHLSAHRAMHGQMLRELPTVERITDDDDGVID